MFLSRVNASDNSDIQIILTYLLNHSKDHQHQLFGLHIFNKALSKLSVVQIKNIFSRIIAFRDAKRSEIRDVVYEIMIYIRNNYTDDDELQRKATEVLLNGLSDVDTDLQNTVYKYWNGLPELSNSALNDRVLFMLRNLYSYDFLKYAPLLLIDLKSPDLKQRLLQQRHVDDDEDDSKYIEYDINVDWKSQNSSLRVPLFTESQQKQIVNGEIDSIQNYLRATQRTLLFDPTLDPSTVYQSKNSFSLQSQGSLLFGNTPHILDRRSQHQMQHTKELVNPQQMQSPSFAHLRKRILRNLNQTNRESALSAVRRRNYKNEQESQQQQRKQGQVTLYRRYRFGDYPDFFINSLAFLLPLQMLVKLDAILARNTFVAILNAVYQELEGSDNRNSFLSELTNAVECILKQPNQCDSMLYSALTEISLTNEIFLNIDPKITITTIPNESANDVLINTILLLENQLNNSRAEHTKDASTTREIWVELSNMYYTLSEYDVCASIFADKISYDQLLSHAIELESNGDYQNALRSYMELVSKEADQLLNKCAIDFSYQSLFNCYEVLGQWEDLETNVIEQITGENDDGVTINYEQLWADEWNKKYLLPHYMRSELRTLLYATSKTTTAKQFLANIQQWLRNPEQSDFIKKNYSEQLMVLNIASNDYLHAKVFSNQYFEDFLTEWSAMSILSGKMRTNKLMNTRRVAEIHKYADLLSAATATIDDAVIAELTDRWKTTFISPADSLQMWEALISYRIFIAEHTLAKFNHRDSQTIDRIIERMFDMQFQLNEMAVKQQNFGLSKTIMGRLNSFKRVYGENTPKSVILYELSEIRQKQIQCIEAQRQQADDKYSEHVLESILEIWTQLHNFRDKNSIILDSNPDVEIKVLHQLNEVVAQSNDIVSHSDIVFCSSTQEKICDLTGCMDECMSDFDLNL